MRILGGGPDSAEHFFCRAVHAAQRSKQLTVRCETVMMSMELGSAARTPLVGELPMPNDARTTTLPMPPMELLLSDPTDRQQLHGRIVCPGSLLVGRMTTAHIVLPEDDRQASHMHFHIDLHPIYCRLNNHSRRARSSMAY